VRSVLSLLVVAATVLAVLWLSRQSPLDVTGVAVQVDRRGPGCAGTTQVTGVITTNGEPGTVSYRWIRSDTGPTSRSAPVSARSG
jgi:hypothetical protein